MTPIDTTSETMYCLFAPAAPYAVAYVAEAAPALPTAVELLNRIARRLLVHGPGEFSYAWEMARHRCLCLTIGNLLGIAKMEAKIEAQRANLAHMSR